MFGSTLYLEEFNPQNGADDSVYVIGGMFTSKVIVSAGDLRAVFRFIPKDDYDLSQRCCSISKEKFYAGVRRYMEAQKKQKGAWKGTLIIIAGFVVKILFEPDRAKRERMRVPDFNPICYKL